MSRGHEVRLHTGGPLRTGLTAQHGGIERQSPLSQLDAIVCLMLPSARVTSGAVEARL